MSTIPASAIVNVAPGVLSAGGNALDLLGLMVTKSNRVPIGTVQSFPSAAAVSNFFGPTSYEASAAAVYFKGYSTATVYPNAMLAAQWPSGGVSAYLQSGDVASLGLATIQAFSGSLTVVIDGYTFSDGSLNLSAATSYSAVAALIQSGLNTSLPTEASVTGSIAAEAASATASISATVMTVTAVASGTLVPGAVLTGTGVTTGTEITSQLSGVTGGVGTYAVSTSQVVASTTVSATYGLFTVTAVASGTISVGQTLSGSGVSSGTQVTALASGEGLTGTYIVNLTQTVASETIAAKPTPLVVTFDSISGSLFLTSGIIGSASSSAFATGTLSDLLLLTSVTGAIVSQGSPALLPGTFMNGVVDQTQNWATFWTGFDPDSGSGNVQKQLFLAWVNSTNYRFAYSCWDTDVTPTESSNAAASLGKILAASNSSGTILTWEQVGNSLYHAVFVSGMIASINFNQTNGRITFFGKNQSGLVASVTSAQVAANLLANGYNYVGAYATANQMFIIYNNGSISGEFAWGNTYVNQIQLNAQMQLALMELLTTINSVPFNAAGAALIYAALQTPIAEAINFGTIRAGVTLSSSQIAEVNNTAGFNIATTIQQVGWYLLIQPATPQVREARGPYAIIFFYCDGGDVQQIALNSVEIQ